MKLPIGIEQLLELIRQLPPKQRERVMALLEEPRGKASKGATLERLLLDGPTWGNNELAKVQAAREALQKWRSA